jgi:hypothetical protein
VSDLEIQRAAEGAYRVGTGGRRFEVSVDAALVAGLGAPDPETLVRASFEFLLAREPASSILPRFDLTVIERYFPEWRAEMERRFS